MIPLKNAENRGKNENLELSAAAGAAVDFENAPMDADLQTIIKLWAELPEAVKLGIVAMVQAVGDTRRLGIVSEPEMSGD